MGDRAAAAAVAAAAAASAVAAAAATAAAAAASADCSPSLRNLYNNPRNLETIQNPSVYYSIPPPPL